jgi:hypothetical protein
MSKKKLIAGFLILFAFGILISEIFFSDKVAVLEQSSVPVTATEGDKELPKNSKPDLEKVGLASSKADPMPVLGIDAQRKKGFISKRKVFE